MVQPLRLRGIDGRQLADDVRLHAAVDKSAGSIGFRIERRERQPVGWNDPILGANAARIFGLEDKVTVPLDGGVESQVEADAAGS